jgi:hypothetical protein
LTRIAFLHGHYSNASLIADAFSSFDAELIHFVEPGLLMQSAGTCPPTEMQAQMKLQEQLSWMQKCSADAIVITCTMYAANLSAEDAAASPVPVFTIDGPFFDEILYATDPQLLIFSNPGTVEPTMQRLRQHASEPGLAFQTETHLIEGAFPLLMENKQEAYREAVFDTLQNLSQSRKDASLSVAQLSMAPVAQQFSKQTGVLVKHPLKSLTNRISQTLHLASK